MQDKCIFLSKFIVQRETGIRAKRAMCQESYVPKMLAKDGIFKSRLALVQEFVIENGRRHTMSIR